MANDIFNREASSIKGVFRSDAVKLTIDTDATMVLVQNLGIRYQQRITRLFELNSADSYFVAGRAEGQMTLRRILGPDSTVSKFYGLFGDVCQVNETSNIVLDLAAKACPGKNVANFKYTVKFPVITDVGISVATQDMLITEDTTMMFSALSDK